jgi:acetyltransferase-like isoleucine patch superfamily enzyme
VQRVIRILANPKRWHIYARELGLRTLGVLTRLPLGEAVFGRLLAWGLGPYKKRKRWLRLTGKTFISPSARIYGPTIEIGRNCFIDDDVTIFVSDENGVIRIESGVSIFRGTIIEVGDGGSVSIGSGTAIQPYCIFNAVIGSLEIGRNVLVAAHCVFVPFRHRFEDPQRLIREQGYESKGGIVVEDDVWLGAGVKVMDRVRINRGAIVGAGSVVTRDVPAHCVVAGVPARILRVRPGYGEESSLHADG